MTKPTLLFAAGLLSAVLLSGQQPALAQSGGLVVISQVYGGGGNAGSTYTNDFVELFNRGTAPVTLTGWSVQYGSATGNFGSAANLVTPLSGSIQPGQYYLIKMAQGGAGTTALPAPDLTNTGTAMSATDGKVALVMGTAALGCGAAATPCSPAQLSLMSDLVGFGNGNVFEGAGAAPRPANPTAVIRLDHGCQDTDNNNADFTVAAPTPRNSAVIVGACGGVLTVAGGVSPNPVVVGDTLTVTAAVAPAATPPSTGLLVYADLAQVGGSPTTSLFDDGIAPDAAAGDNVFTGSVVVAAAPGSASVGVFASDLQGRSANASVSVLVQPPPVVYLPHDIQGAGLASPLNGVTVTVEGVVTARRSNGFFMQTAPGLEDSDPQTSEGLFAFTGSPVPAAAAVGALVRATGPVSEFAGDTSGQTRTNLNGVTTLTALGTSALPAPVPLVAADLTASGGLAQLERVEGMRVVADLTSVAPTESFGCSGACEANGVATSNGVFYAVIAGNPRPTREPGIELGLAVPVCAAGPPCNVPVFDTNPERLFVDSDAIGGPALDVTSGVSLPGVMAIIDSGYGEWTLLPEPGGVTAVGANMTPTPVRAAAAGEFTVGSFNMERFFDTVDDPGVSDVALTAANFDRRLSKASLIIRGYLRMPDVIGVQEVENLATLQAIADRVNADAGMPGEYSAYLEEGNDVGGIDVGFLVRSHVSVASVTQYGKDATYNNPTNGLAEILNDRPPLVLRGVVTPASLAYLPAPVTVVVNHLRSLGDVDTPRVQAKRLAQAEFLGQLLIDLQTEGVPVVSVGDYNAFEVNDGYVDSIGVLLGTQAPPDQVAVWSVLHLDTQMSRAVDSSDYSYVFDGNIQNLDHVLYDPRAAASYAGLSHARVNADFPEVFRNDGTRPERLSDHDPAVAYFRFPDDMTPPVVSVPASISLEADTTGGAVVSFTATALDANGGVNEPVTCAPASGSLFGLGTTTVTCTATDEAGNVGSNAFTVSVSDTTPPALATPGNVAATTSTSGGTAVSFSVSATDIADPAPTVACVPSSGSTFPIGTTTVQCHAADGSGNGADASFTVTVTLVAPPPTPDGRLTGAGHIDARGVHHHFVFRVSEIGARDFGRLEYWVRESRACGRDDDDYAADRHGDQDREYGRDHRRPSGFFEATSVSSAEFSDDPGFTSGRGRNVPGIDTVVFTGTGKWNGRPGYTFTAMATDRGEPGRNRDTFQLIVKNAQGVVVASVDDTIDGGNIESTRLFGRR